MANVRFLSGIESNVNTVPLEQGKVLFAVDVTDMGTYTGFIYYDYFDPVEKRIVRVSMGNGSGGGGSSSLPVFNIEDIAGHTSVDVSTANLSKVTLQLPDILQAKEFIAKENFSLDTLSTLTLPQSMMFGNGFVSTNPYNTTNDGWLRVLGDSSNNQTTLELGMFDSLATENVANQIVARLYNKDGDITDEAILLGLDGNTIFPGTVTAGLFKGDLEGNADSATIALNDASGHPILSTYIIDIDEYLTSGNAYALNIIAGDNSIRKTITLPNATNEIAGLITTGEQTLTGDKILDEKGSFTIKGTDGFVYEGISFSEDSADMPIWFSLAANRGTPVLDPLFTFNADTNTLHVTNITGDNEILPNVNGAYITGLVTHAKHDERGNLFIADYVAKLQDSVNAHYLENQGTEYAIGGFNHMGGEITTLTLPNASVDTAGLITNSDQTLRGQKTLEGYIVFPWLDSLAADLITNQTKYNDPEIQKTGIMGQMGKSSEWQLRGKLGLNGAGFLELSTSGRGSEPIYATQYKDNILSSFVTIIDALGGSVLNHLTIIDDGYLTYEADPDYGLFVDRETAIVGNLYTSSSIRLEAANKESFFYIVPDDLKNIQNSKYHDSAYYAFLLSLYLQEDLEVFGKTYLNNSLRVHDIIPDMHNTYRLGFGTPQDGEEDYFLESYITSMYSKRNILQGPVYNNKIKMSNTIDNPQLIFQRNEDGVVSNDVHLIYTDVAPDIPSYDGDLGLFLTAGADRPWFNVNGALYSRLDDSNYIQIFADNGTSNFLMTTGGVDVKKQRIYNSLDIGGAHSLIQQDADTSYILLDSTPSNTAQSLVYKWGSNTTLIGTEANAGIASLLLQANNNTTFINVVSNQLPSHTINVKVNNTIYTDILFDEDYGFNIHSQLTRQNYLNSYSDSTYALYTMAHLDEDSYLEHFIRNNQYQLLGQATENVFAKLFASTAGSYLQLQSPIGQWAYIRLNDGMGSWDIGLRSTSANTSSFLAPNSLQFKKDNQDNTKIAFSYDDDMGIELYGDSPYIDFHYDRANLNYTTRMQAIAPIGPSNLLKITEQVVLIDDITASGFSRGTGTLLIGNYDGEHLALDGHSLMAKSNGYTVNDLWLNGDGGRVHIGEGGLEINGTVSESHTLYVGGPSILDGTVYITGDTEIASNFKANGTGYFGNTLTIRGDVIPLTSEKFSLGDFSHRWKNIYGVEAWAETFHGNLDGIANIARVANGLTYPLTLLLNGSSWTYDASAPLTVRWFAPQQKGTQGDVLFWDGNSCEWIAPDWVINMDPDDGVYLPLAGGTMRGGLNFAPNKWNKVGNYARFKDDEDEPGALIIQGIGGDSRILLRAYDGGDYLRDIEIKNHSLVNNMLTINREVCVTAINAPYGHYRSVGLIYGVYTNHDDNQFYLGITPRNLPYGQAAINAVRIELNTGIVHCDYGVYGALWNDYAEFRESDELEPGRCVYEVGDDSLTRTTERLMPGCNIVTDTFGFSQGETEKAKTPIATAGRVLAYTLEDRNIFKPGDAVCSGPNGTVSLMTREEIREWPDRIVGTVSCVPTYETWGENSVKVNGRIWIKVR